MAIGHSKSMFALNFKFFTPSPLVRPCYFYMYPSLNVLLFYRVTTPLKKKFCDAYEFSNEKLVSENREKN